jgi:plastocyanin
MRLVSLPAFSLVLGAAACGGGGGGSYSTSPSPGSNPAPVVSSHTTSPVMSGTAFSPAVDTVTAGSTVTWTNQDGIPHTVTSAPGSADTYTGNVAGSATFSHTFNTAGTYAYYCQIHGTPTSGMRGTIVVQ